MRSLHHHLQGVQAILESWQEPEEVRAAGLMCAAYSKVAREEPLYSIDERDNLRTLIGSRAERLVYFLGAIEPRELESAASAGLPVPRATNFESRLAGEMLTVERDDLRDLIAIHLAHIAEHSCAPNGFPAPWLGRAAALARFIGSKSLPIFSHGSAQVCFNDEEGLLRAYAAAYAAPAAVEHGCRLMEAAELVPFVAEPFVLLGLIALARGEPVEARRLAVIGQARLLEWGTAWDKRLSETEWFSIALFIEQASNVPQSESEFLTNVVRELFQTGPLGPEALLVRLSSWELLALPAPEESEATVTASTDNSSNIFCADDANNIPERFSEFIVGLLDDHPHRALGFYPGLRERPWWETESFPLVKALEASAKEIAAEFSALDPTSFHAESERIQRGGNWDVSILYERGKKRIERCEAVPITTRIVEEHSTLRTHAGLVYFSRLAPGTIVAPHRGPTNIRLRCHLGIKIPDGCGISVDNVTRTWQQGKCLVFDDSFTHAAWNSSNEERVVLIVDIWHPDLDPEEVELLSGLHRYGMSIGENLNKYWTRNDAALVAAG